MNIAMSFGKIMIEQWTWDFQFSDEPIQMKEPLNINDKYLPVADKNAKIQKRPWMCPAFSINQLIKSFSYLTWHQKGLCQMGAGGSACVCVECL